MRKSARHFNTLTKKINLSLNFGDLESGAYPGRELRQCQGRIHGLKGVGAGLRRSHHFANFTYIENYGAKTPHKRFMC